jgi:hypothetical protein
MTLLVAKKEAAVSEAELNITLEEEMSLPYSQDFNYVLSQCNTT